MTDMDRIEEHLYLGSVSAADDVNALLQNGIKYVLSVFEGEVRNKCDSITYKTISVADLYDEDLLSHFFEAFQYIRAAQDSQQGVLVHCQMGVSRSATVVIAYLMNKYKKSFNSIKELVKSKRYVDPNNGFVSQLKLFEEMDANLDGNNRNLRKYLVQIVLKSDIFFMKWTNQLSEYFDKLDNIEKLTGNLNLGGDYLCSICDFKLFNELHVIERRRNATDSEPEVESSEICGYVYVEPQKWMKELLEVKESETINAVKCPQCKQELIQYKQRFSHIPCHCNAHKGMVRGMRFRVFNKNIKYVPHID